MGNAGQSAHELDVLALAAGQSAQLLHEVGAVVGVLEGLDVVVTAGSVDGGSLMGDNRDALILGFLQDGGNGLYVEGNHTDGVPILGQQALHIGSLVSALGAAAVEDVAAGLLVVSVNALFHALEPSNVGHLGHNGDLVIGAGAAGGFAGSSGGAGRSAGRGAGRSAAGRTAAGSQQRSRHAGSHQAAENSFAVFHNLNASFFELGFPVPLNSAVTLSAGRRRAKDCVFILNLFSLFVNK